MTYRFLITGFVNPNTNATQLHLLHGLPFGLASSLLQFNRVPSLTTAIARRVLGIIKGHYFDDNATLDMSCNLSHGHRTFRKLF
eukprot:11516421-Karenia_brevis.AAC.1